MTTEWTRTIPKSLTPQQWSKVLQDLTQVFSLYKVLIPREELESEMKEWVLEWFGVQVDASSQEAREMTLTEVRALFTDCVRTLEENTIQLWYNEDFNGLWAVVKRILKSSRVDCPGDGYVRNDTGAGSWSWVREELDLPKNRPKETIRT